MDGAFFGSFTYALAHQKIGVQVLARPESLDGHSTYYGMIFTRRDSGIKTIRDMKQKRRHIVLLEKNDAGYRNLLKLNYNGYINRQYIPILNKVFPRIDWELLEKHKEGVICLTACASGPLAYNLLEYGEDGELITPRSK